MLFLGDYERLYMIVQKEEDAYNVLCDKFNRLVWKRAHNYYKDYMPQGIVVYDLFQDGYTGFHESIYSYNEEYEVGFAYYANMCVISSILSTLRKTRANAYKFLSSSHSLDYVVAEGENYTLHEALSQDTFQNNPQRMALFQEADCKMKLSTLKA